MSPDFLVDDDLKTIGSAQLQTVIDYFDDLRDINTSITNLLKDTDWTGDAHDKCEAAIGMMEQYRADLESLTSDLKMYVRNVVICANDFVDISDKVESIRGV